MPGQTIKMRVTNEKELYIYLFYGVSVYAYTSSAHLDTMHPGINRTPGRKPQSTIEN